MTMYRTLPNLPEAGPHELYRDRLGLIVPCARTNLITNPSFETNTTGWTAVGGSIARSTTYQAHGAYSLAVTPGAGLTDGAYFGTVSLTSGTTYAVSAKVRGAVGVPYTISVATTGGAALASFAFRGTGQWQWVWVFYTETSSTTRRVYLAKSGSASTALFYVDGVQVEACGSEGVFVTTYIDGDQPGLIANQFPPAYGWNGTAHASTSYRTAQTRAGGQVVKLKDYGFLLATLIGLGLAPAQVRALPFAQLDGAQYQDTRKDSRQFSLTGRWQEDSPRALAKARGDLAALHDRDLTALRQPLVLSLQAQRRDGTLLGDEARVIASYTSGLEGEDSYLPTVAAAITYTQHLPLILGLDGGAALTAQQSLASADYIAQRSPSGTWTALRSGAPSAAPSEFTTGLDGSVYACYVAGASSLVQRWTGSTWSTLGGFASDDIVSLTTAPNGDIIATGSFTTINAVGANRIARWNGSVWAALGTGLNGKVYGAVFGPDGSLYVGGDFTTAGGGAAAAVAKWDGSAWSALGTGITGGGASVRNLAIGPSGTLYVSGDFTTAGGGAAADIAQWNGSAWSALGSGLNNVTSALAIGPSGLLYAAGSFTTAGGVSANRIAQWNGSAWSALGGGISATNVFDLAIAGDGTLYAGGAISGINVPPVVLPDSFVRWNGAAWTFPDIDLPGSANVNAIEIGRDGTLTVGYTTTGTATAASVTTVTNGGTTAAYPTLIISGPSSGTAQVYDLVNTTTGRAIYFNLIVSAGETVTLTLTPSNITCVSSARGNILGAIVPGSNLADFPLQPGANTITFFASASTVTAVLQWPTGYASLDDTLY